MPEGGAAIPTKEFFMMSRLLMAGAFFVCLVGTANAQATGHAAPPDAFRVFSDKELTTLSSGKGALTLSTLSDHENHYVLVAGRTGPGEVEVHEHWIDYMAIQQGEAEFIFGGSATGMRDTGPGEKRGGTITGGTVVTIKPGDFLVVPAGQPHLTMIRPGSSFRAIVFKARE
jgi:mannose-6-phosphate isomerase-like protein (cupin superfamily)